MIEPFLHKVGVIVFAHDLNLAAQLVIRAFHQLELTNFLMLLDVLPQRALSAFVVAFDDFE